MNTTKSKKKDHEKATGPDYKRVPRHSSLPTLLCVDDDPGVIAAIEMRLRPYAVSVLSSYTGMQGYWQAVERRPDLIITDLRMPQGDGAHFLECLKQNQKTADIPVMVLSGLRSDDLAGRMRHLGAENLLQKPISGNDLLAAIAKHIPLRMEKEEPEASQMVHHRHDRRG